MVKNNLIKKLYVDVRESESRKENAQTHFEKILVEIKMLDCGDFLFLGNDGTEVLFEYKTAKDFFSSLENNHLHNQTIRAWQNYKYQFVIIESKNLEKDAVSYYYESGVDVTPAQIRGAIASLNRFTTVVVQNKEKDCFKYMQTQAEKIIRAKPILYKFERKDANPVVNWLNCIHGIGDYSERIAKELDLHTWNDLNKITKKDLMKVSGIGAKKADIVLKSIG